MEEQDQIGYQTFHDQRPGIEGIPANFCDLFDLNELSDKCNNPYHAAVRHLIPLTKLEPIQEHLIKNLVWLGRTRETFFELLQAMDSRAWLLVAYWLGLLCSYKQWWLTERARVECHALCATLENVPDERVRRMLEVPSRACGYEMKDLSMEMDLESAWSDLDLAMATDYA